MSRLLPTRAFPVLSQRSPPVSARQHSLKKWIYTLKLGFTCRSSTLTCDNRDEHENNDPPSAGCRGMEGFTVWKIFVGDNNEQYQRTPGSPAGWRRADGDDVRGPGRRACNAQSSARVTAIKG